MTSSPRWTVGQVTITTAIECHNEMPAGLFAPAAAGVALGDRPGWLSPWAIRETGELRFVIQAFCVEADGRKILVDTCAGPRELPAAYAGMAGNAAFIDALSDAGYGRDDVDLVICTHLHFDHVGWNTIWEDGAWVPTFRRARYVVARQEYEYWNAAAPHERASTNLPTFDDAVLPLFDAGVVDLVPGDHQVSAAIRLVPTPGHTPGHVAVAIASDGASALITGDCAHNPVQLEEPDWYSIADLDPEAATATRRRLLLEYADKPVLLLGTHFPPPTAGHLVTVDGHVRFRPAPPAEARVG